MKIGIDITCFLDQYAHRGIGYYAKQITMRLIQDESHEWILFGYGNLNQNLKELGLKSIHDKVKFISLGKKRNSTAKNLLFFKFKFLPKIKKEKLDLLYAPHFEQGLPLGVCKTAVVVHDLTPLLINKFSSKNKLWNSLKKYFYIHNLNQAKKADIILTHSLFTKNELIEKGGFSAEKIYKVYLGVKEIFRESNIDKDQRNIRRINSIYNITNPYIINYGGIEPNKNTEKLFDLFAQIQNRFPDLKLVLISKDYKLGWDNKVKPLTPRAEYLIKYAKDLKIHHRIVFTGQMDEQHMPIVLNNAKLLITLSSYEGFGLTSVEGMAAGVPVIASKSSCIPEITGDASILLNVNDTKSIATVVEKLMTNENYRQEYIEKGIQRSKIFTWDNAAFETHKYLTDTQSRISSAPIKAEIEVEKEEISANEEIIVKESEISLAANANLQTKEMATKEEKLKITYITPVFWPSHGGAETNCLALAKGMSESGATVQVFTTDYNAVGAKSDSDLDSIKISRFKRFNNSFYFSIYPSLIFKLLMDKSDVYHVHGFGFITQDIAVLIKKIFSPRSKFINTPHGPFMALKNYSFFAWLLKQAYTLFLRFQINFVYSNIIQVNEFQKDWMKKIYGINEKKVVYFPNGIYDKPKLSAIKSRELIKKYKLEKSFIVSYTGRFEEYKGIGSIIDAAKICTAKHPDIKFVLIGRNGGYFDTMVKKIKDAKLENNFLILESASDEVKFTIMSLSKIYLFVSEWEAFGISILEAMQFGNAVISTRTEGGKLLVGDNNGELVDFNSPDQIANKIGQLYKNESRLKDISKNNINLVKQYSWSNITNNYNKFIYGITKK